jgi:hypothetical protein
LFRANLPAAKKFCGTENGADEVYEEHKVASEPHLAQSFPNKTVCFLFEILVSACP